MFLDVYQTAGLALICSLAKQRLRCQANVGQAALHVHAGTLVDLNLGSFPQGRIQEWRINKVLVGLTNCHGIV